MSLFVDTSAWYAAADAGDISNSRAKAILSSEENLVTSDHVLVETWDGGMTQRVNPVGVAEGDAHGAIAHQLK